MLRQGSQMSKYVKRRRKPSPEDTWGNQGSVESLSGDDVDRSNVKRFVRYPDKFIRQKIEECERCVLEHAYSIISLKTRERGKIALPLASVADVSFPSKRVKRKKFSLKVLLFAHQVFTNLLRSQKGKLLLRVFCPVCSAIPEKNKRLLQSDSYGSIFKAIRRIFQQRSWFERGGGGAREGRDRKEKKSNDRNFSSRVISTRFF